MDILGSLSSDLLLHLLSFLPLSDILQLNYVNRQMRSRVKEIEDEVLWECYSSLLEAANRRPALCNSNCSKIHGSGNSSMDNRMVVAGNGMKDVSGREVRGKVDLKKALRHFPCWPSAIDTSVLGNSFAYSHYVINISQFS